MLGYIKKVRGEGGQASIISSSCCMVVGSYAAAADCCESKLEKYLLHYRKLEIQNWTLFRAPHTQQLKAADFAQKKGEEAT